MAGKRGTYAVGRERRNVILDLAAERFASEGYSRTSLADIARAAGITTPGLAHHFPTKQHLLLAITDRRFDEAMLAAKNIPDDADGLGPLRFMARYAEVLASQPALTQLFVLVAADAADPSSRAHALYKDRYARVVSDLTEAFERGVRSGALRADLDFEAIARECIALSDGIQLQSVLNPGGVDHAGVVRQHLERLAPTIVRQGSVVRL